MKEPLPEALVAELKVPLTVKDRELGGAPVIAIVKVSPVRGLGVTKVRVLPVSIRHPVPAKAILNFVNASEAIVKEIALP